MKAICTARASRSALVVLATLIGAACDDDNLTGPSDPVAAVTVSPATGSLKVGDSLTLSATLKDTKGRVLTGRSVTWSSEPSRVATVNSKGIVTARDTGTVTITATSEGVKGTTKLTVGKPTLAAGDIVYAGWTSIGRPRLTLRSGSGASLRHVLPESVLPHWFLTYPDVSPDRARIVFAASQASDAFVYVVNVDGSGLRRLTSVGDEGQPVWSPDGGKVAYVGGTSDADIWVMNGDGTGAVNLTEHYGSTSELGPAWSPLAGAGTRIAFSQATHERARILTMRPDGSDVRAVTAEGAHEDYGAAWSPDAKTIAFARSGSGTDGFDLFTVASGGGTPVRLLSLPGDQRWPKWSPDGSVIAFSSNHEVVDGIVDARLYSVRADGSGLARLNGPGEFGVQPSFAGRS